MLVLFVVDGGGLTVIYTAKIAAYVQHMLVNMFAIRIKQHM